MIIFFIVLMYDIHCFYLLLVFYVSSIIFFDKNFLINSLSKFYSIL